MALLDFAPQLLYFATPSLEQDCYLQVKARNTSSFPILASDKVRRRHMHRTRHAARAHARGHARTLTRDASGPLPRWWGVGR